MGNLLQPIRSTTQIWEVTPQQYGVFAFVPQTSFRGKINSGVAECRLFSWAAFKSNHRHSKLTNRNVALRAAHRNSRIWICRKKRYQCKEWEQRKKRFIFLAVSRRLPCACDWKLFSARGAQRTVPSILVTLVGTVGIFSAPSMSVFASWHHKSEKINIERKEHNFLSESWVLHGYPILLWRELLLENLSLSQYESSV